MKTLAVLIDEINNSKELIRFAALLGIDINAKVHVLHIQNPQVFGAQVDTQGYMGMAGAPIPPDPALYQKITDKVKVKVSGFIKEIKAELSGNTSIEFESEIGHASAILKEEVEHKTYDMVMLQDNTEQNFWLQDAVTMDVVRDVSCPVWIIPPHARYQSLNKIVYATDYNKEDIKTLKSLIDLAKPFDPEILALHTSNDADFNKKLKSEGFAAMLSKDTGYSKVSVKIIVPENEKDSVESLVNEAEKAKANLIVVLKENKNFFERLFKSSFTAELVKESQLPILVF